MTFDARDLPERSVLLVVLILAPTIWFAHFLVTYAAVAVWCARFAPADGGLGVMPRVVAVLTAIAITGIVLTGWGGWTRHRHGGETAPHDMDTPGDRHRFLGFATLLLSGLSAIATLYVGVSTFFFSRCW
jgi:uncharacterized iron-regulated membrane protein